MEDAGKITAKTNADETSCDLGVKRKYIKRLSIQKFFNVLFIFVQYSFWFETFCQISTCR